MSTNFIHVEPCANMFRNTFVIMDREHNILFPTYCIQARDSIVILRGDLTCTTTYYLSETGLELCDHFNDASWYWKHNWSEQKISCH